jgi:DNA-binding NtrC family response regulator
MSERRTVLIVDSDPGFAAELAHVLASEGLAVRRASDLAAARRAAAEGPTDAAVVADRLPDGDGVDFVKELRARPEPPVVLLTALAPDVRATVEAVRAGALDVLEKPVFAERVIAALLPALDSRAAERRTSRGPAAHELARPPIVGDSPAMRELRDRVARVAAAPHTTTLVQGESGAGKELVARAVHFDGRRATRPFVAINCAALNENILEAELFGYERGAFTGAAANGKQGLLEAADGGSLFLDEVGEMSPALQAKLLRFLQEGTFKRVGGVKDLTVDVRVIAATNRELWEDVRAGSFRKDLFFRLNVMTLRVPSLRERPEDVRPLAEHFLRRFAADLRKPAASFSDEALRKLAEYEWPGNVRELRNVCEYATIVCDEEVVEARHLALGEHETHADGGAKQAAGDALPLRDRSLKSAEEDLIRLVLGETRFNVTRAARLLGINRSTLYHKMRGMGLDAAERAPARRVGV